MSEVRGTATAETFAHPALFYRGQQEYLAGTVPFVRAGMSAEEPVAVAVPGANLALLRRELGAAARDVTFIDMADVGRNPGRILPRVLLAFADAHPGRRVRIIGEPVWSGRSAVEYPACAQHEALINVAFAGRTATILCPYDAAALDPDVLADAAATHPVMLENGDQRYSDTYDPGRVVASYNEPLPEPPESTATLVVDSGRLAYAREFTAAHARRFGLSGRRVEDAVLVVAELAANSVAHGGGSGTLRIWPEDDLVVCQLSDAGRIGDPLAGRIPASPLQDGGHGLLLVNLLADLVRTHTTDQRTTVRAYLRPRARGGA